MPTAIVSSIPGVMRGESARSPPPPSAANSGCSLRLTLDLSRVAAAAARATVDTDGLFTELMVLMHLSISSRCRRDSAMSSSQASRSIFSRCACFLLAAAFRRIAAFAARKGEGTPSGGDAAATAASRVLWSSLSRCAFFLLAVAFRRIAALAVKKGEDAPSGGDAAATSASRALWSSFSLWALPLLAAAFKPTAAAVVKKGLDFPPGEICTSFGANIGLSSPSLSIPSAKNETAELSSANTLGGEF